MKRTTPLAEFISNSFFVPENLNNKSKIDLYVYGLGNFYADMNNIELSLEQFDKALNIPADDPKEYYVVYINKGNLLLNMGKPWEAMECYEKAKDSDPGRVMGYLNKGNILMHQKRYDESLACYKQSLDLDPNQNLSYLNIGIIKHLQGIYEEALRYYDNCMNSDNVDLAKLNRGFTLQQMDRLEEAASKFTIDPTTGKKVAAYTTWSADPYEPQVNNQGIVDCKTGKYFITVTTMQPVWTTGFKDLSATDKKIWKQFLKDVFIHEQGHVDIVHKGYNGKGGFDYVINRVIGMTKQDAVNFINGVASDTAQASIDYDAATGHGPILIRP